MKGLGACRRMAVAVGVFSTLVILPTLAIGLYGSVVHERAGAPEFLASVLLREQTPLVAATVAVGLIAAAMSTADSQLFALGAELRSLIEGEERRVMLYTRLAIGGFAAAAFVFAIVSSDQLVLLARVSFAGTAMLAPLILSGVLTERPRGVILLPTSAAALAVFLASLGGVVPDRIGSLQLDLALFATLALVAGASALWPARSAR